MKASAILLLLALLTAIPVRTQAMFMHRETRAVPIARVITNLERQLQANTNDVMVLYHLARIHSMAYSANLETVDVIPDPEIWRAVEWPVFHGFGVPRSVQRPSDPLALAAAREHLGNAIRLYQRAATLVPDAVNSNWLARPVHLGLAWCLEQAGRRDEAIKAYRQALALAWSIEVDQGHLDPGVCYSKEIIGYLLPLLDSVKDAGEIKQLRRKKETVVYMERSVTPILVPLEPNARFEDLVNPAASIPFDLDGSGLLRRWGWITPKAAWLVYDSDGSGHITSGLQMFGNVTFWIFWRDGYDALSSLDDDGDGRLTGPELRGLALWQDLNCNGICDPGEVRPLADYGITALECSSQLPSSGMRYHPRGVTFRDGTTRPTYDWITPSLAPK